MAQCPFLENCAFMHDETFRQMHGLIQRFQQAYCQDDYSSCARHQIASVLGESFVPSPMIPTQVDWAQQIIRDSKGLVEETLHKQ